MPQAVGLRIVKSTDFLRVLEYYAGILFLTTNRVGDFDEAFASRIHISLHYPQLTLENTEAIFKLNLGMIDDRFKKAGRDIKIEQDNIVAYAKAYFNEHPEERWNGRQIRNACGTCQTALALAEYRAQGSSHLRAADPGAVVELKVGDLEVVSTAYLQFMQYLNEIRGKDAEMWAKGMKLRAREIDVLLYAGAKDRDRATSAVVGEKDEKQPEAALPRKGDRHTPQPMPPDTHRQPNHKAGPRHRHWGSSRRMARQNTPRGTSIISSSIKAKGHRQTKDMLGRAYQS